MRPSSRVIVVRGDLYSDTGYGRATRALCGLLQSRAQWLFVSSLHTHAERQQNALSLPLVSDEALANNPLFRGAIVLNICLPDKFIRVPGAINVGYFFWETAALSNTAFWKIRMLSMDHLWAPSHWQSAWLRSVTGRDRVPVIPWPFEAREPVVQLDSLFDPQVKAPMNHEFFSETSWAAFEGEHMNPPAGTGSTRLNDLLTGDDVLFLAVQTDAPRKGLPLLLSSWMQFKTSSEGRVARLIIKLSSIDASLDPRRLHIETSRAIHQARERFGVSEPDIWLMYERLTSSEMRMLFSRADAFVSASMGEGFGGPIAEALLEDTPVIVPRHTAMCDLLDEAYPLIVASTAVRMKLRDNLDIYSPSSPWHVIDDISFVDRLQTFVRMPQTERAAIAQQAKTRLLAAAGASVVADAVALELRSYGVGEIAA